MPEWGYPLPEDHYYGFSSYKNNYFVNKNTIFQYSLDLDSSEHLILAGGSNTFGQGIISDNLKQILEKKWPKKNIQYLAYPGWGPPHVLKRLGSLNLKQLIPQSEGLFIYHYYRFHLNRSCVSLSFLEWNKGVIPRYVIESNTLVSKGIYSASVAFHMKMVLLGLKYTLKSLFGPSATLDNFNILNMDKCLKLNAKILKAMEKEYLSQFPKGKFLVALMPGFNDEVDYDVYESLTAEKIQTIKGHDHVSFSLKDISTDQYFQNDGHVKTRLLEKFLPIYKFIFEEQ